MIITDLFMKSEDSDYQKKGIKSRAQEMWKVSRAHALWLFRLLYNSPEFKKKWRGQWENINVSVLEGYKKHSILTVDFISQSSY